MEKQKKCTTTQNKHKN